MSAAYLLFSPGLPPEFRSLTYPIGAPAVVAVSVSDRQGNLSQFRAGFLGRSALLIIGGREKNSVGVDHETNSAPFPTGPEAANGVTLVAGQSRTAAGGPCV
jgi:hypothetical protein